jgi:hypothetical protein
MGKTWKVLNYAGLALFVLVPLTGLFLLLAGSLRLGPPSEAAGGRRDTICTRCNPALIPLFKAKGDWCAQHDLPQSQCILCDPSLTLAVAPRQQGQRTAAHNAALDAHMATCTKCNPALIPAFKAKGDWCDLHNLPKSQCAVCNPSLKLAAADSAQGQRAAVGNPAPDPQHMATCTRCNPALIPGFKAKGDWCDLHNFPKSQCVACNPALGPAYKAKGDWCDLHNLPKSQCTVCTPSLKQPPAPKVEAPKIEPMCVMHNIPLSQCIICRPAPAPKEPPKAAPEEPEAEPAPDKAVQPPDAAPEPQ